jgi:hypothetical protein
MNDELEPFVTHYSDESTRRAHIVVIHCNQRIASILPELPK